MSLLALTFDDRLRTNCSVFIFFVEKLRISSVCACRICAGVLILPVCPLPVSPITVTSLIGILTVPMRIGVSPNRKSSNPPKSVNCFVWTARSPRREASGMIASSSIFLPASTAGLMNASLLPLILFCSRILRTAPMSTPRACSGRRLTLLTAILITVGLEKSGSMLNCRDPASAASVMRKK